MSISLMKLNSDNVISPATQAEAASALAVATPLLQGAMSANDKAKLDALENLDVSVFPDNGNLSDNQNGSTITNEGATFTVTVLLPLATVGQVYHGIVIEAYQLGFAANGSDTIKYGITGSSGTFISNSVPGACITLKCVKAGVWNVTYGMTDAWTLLN